MTDDAAPKERKFRVLTGIKAIADYLGIKERQARHWQEHKRIPTFTMGDQVCARDIDLDDAMAKRVADAQAEREASAVAAEQPPPDVRRLLRPRRR